MTEWFRTLSPLSPTQSCEGKQGRQESPVLGRRDRGSERLCDLPGTPVRAGWELTRSSVWDAWSHTGLLPPPRGTSLPQRQHSTGPWRNLVLSFPFLSPTDFCPFLFLQRALTVSHFHFLWYPPSQQEILFFFFFFLFGFMRSFSVMSDFKGNLPPERSPTRHTL